MKTRTRPTGDHGRIPPPRACRRARSARAVITGDAPPEGAGATPPAPLLRPLRRRVTTTPPATPPAPRPLPRATRRSDPPAPGPAGITTARSSPRSGSRPCTRRRPSTGASPRPISRRAGDLRAVRVLLRPLRRGGPRRHRGAAACGAVPIATARLHSGGESTTDLERRHHPPGVGRALVCRPDRAASAPAVGAFELRHHHRPPPDPRAAFKDTTPSALVGDHVEGQPDTAGTVNFDQVTVTPKAKSGRAEVSRELIDASPPTHRPVVSGALRESYSQITESTMCRRARGRGDRGPGRRGDGDHGRASDPRRARAAARDAVLPGPGDPAERARMGRPGGR